MRLGRFLLYCTVRGIRFEMGRSLYCSRVALSVSATLSISQDSDDSVYPRLIRSFFNWLAWVQKSSSYVQILLIFAAWLKGIDFFVAPGW